MTLKSDITVRENFDNPILGSVVDLFCGVGGLSHGFKLEGFPIAAGIDVDEDCRFAFEFNNDAKFIKKDISKLRVHELNNLFIRNEPRILVGCAPCQPFSSYSQKELNPKWKLVESFSRLISKTLPDIVSMENVPRLMNFGGGKIFKRFLKTLDDEGYKTHYQIIYAPDYGVPQQRSRLVLLASKLGDISMIAPTHTHDNYVTVRAAIGQQPTLSAGQTDSGDPLHRTSKLSPINLKRIRASKPGGTWRDWDRKLVANCHRIASGDGYSSVYGRMLLDAPSPTITTQFFGFGNGRFGHPEQDRGLSLREGAILQSFPSNYQFVKTEKEIQFKKVGRMIGNAVPVQLSQAIARSIKLHLLEKIDDNGSI
jgi:DNA (cytosine-5)-methyltransferase 1